MYAVEISYYHKCHYLLSVQQAESDYFCGVFSIEFIYGLPSFLVMLFDSDVVW